MTDMVYGRAPMVVIDPILPRWWRTVDRWTFTSILVLFAIGILLGLASSPPLASKNGLAAILSGAAALYGMLYLVG